MPEHDTVDLLIVGSGPAGSTYARVVGDALPSASILVVEVGPAAHPVTGMHSRDMPDHERIASELATQGPDAGVPRDGGIFTSSTPEGKEPGVPPCFPGLFLVGESVAVGGESGLPAAAMSSGVGGMGLYWSGFCPRPTSTERVTLIPDDELDALYDRAEQLLLVSKDHHRGDGLLDRFHKVIAEEFDQDAPGEAPVGFMPIALSDVGGLRRTGGPWSILGDVADRVPGLEIRAETLARRILIEHGVAVGAELENRQTGERYEVRAKRVVACADSLRTPQLLFASGIRPDALGHHLNDHFQMSAPLQLAEEYWSEDTGSGFGTVLLPFIDQVRPMQGQVFPLSRIGISVNADEGARAALKTLGALSFYGAKDIQFSDRLEFSETEQDFYGMPAMTVHYTLTDTDRRTLQLMRDTMSRAAKVVGTMTAEPVLAPGGSSLHYQGTLRMGAIDDGTSVCDTYSQVWGVDNLCVGGNGVIPTSTAANPTLTTVALAVRAATKLADGLSAELASKASSAGGH